MHQNRLRFFEDLILLGKLTGTAPAAKSKKPHDYLNVSEMEREKAAVLQYFRDLDFYFYNEGELIWTVNAYFRRVVDLINSAYRFIANNFADLKKCGSPYAPVVKALQEILSCLEQYYGRYMNLNIGLPVPHEIQLKDALVNSFFSFKAAAEEANVFPALLDIIESVYADFIGAEDYGKTSYGRTFYLSSLITALGKLRSMTDTTIEHTLISLNFNNPAFLKYYTQKLPEDPGVLAFTLKEVNQTTAMPGFALNPLSPTAKEQLSAWLSHEISYLANYSAGATPPVPKNTAPGQKIMTTLSVPQLAHLLKLFTDTGIIVHENKTELLEIFTAIFRTEKTENISASSMRNHYYNDDAAIGRSVQGFLKMASDRSKGII